MSMKFNNYVADRSERDPEFAQQWELQRPIRELQKTIIRARLAAGLSQRELAGRLGVSQPAVARLEAGDHVPRIETLQRLSDVLGVTFNVTIEPRTKLRA